MAGRIAEKFDSRQLTIGPTGVESTWKFFVYQCADEDEALGLTIAATPELYFLIPRGSANVNPVGGGCFETEVKYSPNARSAAPTGTGNTPPGTESGRGKEGGGEKGGQPVGREWSFSTKGGTQRIYQSKEVVASYAPPGITASDPKLRIGDSEKGTDGCDIIAPSGEFSCSLKLALVTFDYFLFLLETTGKTNKGEWYMFFEREVLFLGADGRYTDADGWNLGYFFRFNETITDYKVCDDITVDVKAGWDYQDVRYQRVKDPTTNVMIDRPFEVHIHRVYEMEDFKLFGILK